MMKSKVFILCFTILLIFGQIVFGQEKGVGNRTVSKLPSKEKRWALIIGVSNYEDGNITSLPGANNDAKALRNALRDYAGFDERQIITLTTDETRDRQPTKNNILRYLGNLQGTVPKDGLLLVAFSGHGIERQNQAFLLASDTPYNDNVRVLERTALSVSNDFKELIRDTGVSQVVVLLDACRNDPSSGRSGADNLLTKAYSEGFDFDVRNKEVEAFATLYATSIGERAYEYIRENKGYFTWAFIEGLKGGAANEAGEITLGALIRYVEKYVPQQVKIDLGSKKTQKPFSEVGGFAANELVLAVNLEQQRKAKLNESIVSTSIPVNPLATSYFKKALEFRNKGNSQDALDALARAISIDPNFYEAYIERGSMYQSSFGVINYDKAMIDFNKAVALKPYSAEAYNFRGNIYSIRGLLETAVNEYSKAIELDPINGIYYNNRAETYLKDENFDLALSDCRVAVKLGWQFGYLTLGEIYFAKKEFEAAVESYTSLIKSSPLASEYYKKRAVAYEKLGKIDLSKADLKQAEDLERQYKESSSCILTASQNNISITTDGGSLGILISGSKEMNIDPISSSPKDLTVTLDLEASIKYRKFFIIKSTSKKTGEYTIKFRANCGGEALIPVKVR